MPLLKDLVVKIRTEGVTPSQRSLHEALIRHGLVPDDCRSMDINIGIDGIAVIRYEVTLTKERIQSLGEAFMDFTVTDKLIGR